MIRSGSSTTDRSRFLDALFPLGGRHAWIGTSPPFLAETLNVQHAPNYRMSSMLHGVFDSVWHVETPLSAVSGAAFEIIVDEMIRLLGAQGRLVFRFRETEDLSVINLKQLIGRRLNVFVRVNAEWTIDGEYTIDFAVERQRLPEASDRRWTFAVITQGSKRDMVVRFLESIRSADPGREHEILVWGPLDPAYAPFGVQGTNRVYRDDVAEISRKKNDIADAATHPNLLIAHDRYALNDDFFSGFDAFGYDFDLCAIAQRYEDGTPFPAYCALPGHNLVRTSTVIECTDDKALWPLQYVNGGLLVAKTHTLRQIRFNDILFWCQAEDVELARQFRERGLPPRVNRFSSATTYGIDRHWYSGLHFTLDKKYAAPRQAAGFVPPRFRRRVVDVIGRELRRASRKLVGCFMGSEQDGG